MEEILGLKSFKRGLMVVVSVQRGEDRRCRIYIGIISKRKITSFLAEASASFAQSHRPSQVHEVASTDYFV